MRWTVRTRLTLAYSGLFLLTSSVLLVVVNLLLRNTLISQVKKITPSLGTGFGTEPRPLSGAGILASPSVRPSMGPTPDAVVAGKLGLTDLPFTVLRYQWGVTAITIGVLALVSLGAGWWLSGRLLRPLQKITTTARRLSLSNLHERIALGGPRDELRELADTFDAMLVRLEHSVDSRQRFIANAAHELRTPLAVQRAAIQIGLDDGLPDHLRGIRDTLLTANRRSESIIEALLILAQAEHGLDATEPVRLDRLARGAVAETPREHEVNVTLSAEPVTVEGDPVLLGRLLANLVGNAIRHNRDGGRVDVTLTADGRLAVRNTGPTVPADQVPELFEPFRHLHADGTGLGLSIVASIAAAHQAVLDARPNPGGGLTVTLTFPLSAGQR